MMTAVQFGRRTSVVATGIMMAAGLAACGGSSSAGGAATAAPTPSAAPSGGAAGGRSSQQFTEIEQCLKAAGIAVPTFSARPRPSGSARPSFVRPSGSARPFGGAGRGGFGRFDTPQAQAALKACGITLPSFRPGGSRSPQA